VDFKALSDSQKRSILQSFVLDVSNVTGLPERAVRDSTGLPSSVTLSAGSLVAGAALELPPGGTVAQASQQLRGEAFADRLRASLAEVGVRAPEVADHPIHHRHAIDVRVEVSHGCLVPGTRYEASNASEGAARVANTSACQSACVEEKACEYFTFFPSNGTCLLRGGAVMVPVGDPDALSGPRLCAGLPVVPPGGWVAPELASSGEGGGGGGISIWWWLLGIVLVLGGMGVAALALLPRRRRKRSGRAGGHKYAPLSRQELDEEDGEASQSGTASGGPSREEYEEDGENATWWEVDAHPFSMDPADHQDEDSEDPGHGGGPSLKVASRELRGPASGEATFLGGFLGTESLRREANGP